MSEWWEWSQIESFLPAYSKSRVSATSLLTVKPDLPLTVKSVSLLPAKPNPPVPPCSHRRQNRSFLPTHSESRFSATSEAASTPASVPPMSPDPLLPAKPVLPLPAKLDPPLPACSHRSQIVREVRVSMSDPWDQTCQRFNTEHVRVMRASLLVLREWACQSCGSSLSFSESWESECGLGRVVRVSRSELSKRECQR